MKISTNYQINSLNNKKNKNNKPSFRRNWNEHISWGAKYIKESKKVDFKLFSFPDAKMVFVELAKKAGQNMGGISERIVQVLGAQGLALTITNIMTKDDETAIYPMENKGNGIYEAKNIKAEENAQYRYIIVDKDNNINIVKDPYSKQQPDINGWSEIYNPNNYEWKATNWLEGKDTRRIMRNPSAPKRGLANLIIEEVNIPTLSKEGTYEKAKAYIDRVADKGLATAIEIMPLENTFSLQWGYDGVDKLAPNSKMGTAVQLKELIDYAHEKGLNVIMDMVPNHIGPDGNYLSKTGPYKWKSGRFGTLLNYENLDHNKYVRDWMVNAALWWANEFKVDGLRLDMTGDCESDLFLQQLVYELNNHNPDVFLIAEDAREQIRDKVIAYNSGVRTHEENINNLDRCVEILKDINKYTTPGSTPNYNLYPNSIGFDTAWDFVLLHPLKNALIDPRNINLDIIDSKIWESVPRVKYVMSHDEIGNNDGTRLIHKILTHELNLYDRVEGVDKCDKGQKAAQLSQRLSECFIKGELENLSDKKFKEKLLEIGMQHPKNITLNDIKVAFDIAVAKQKLGIGTVMTIPGPKMFFQGDDELNVGHFKFFREFSSDKYHRQNPQYIQERINEKGYDPIESIARMDSLVDKIKLDENNKYYKEYRAFMDELKKYAKASVFVNGDIVKSYKDTHHNVHVHQIKNGDAEVLVIKNFGNNFHNGNYGFAYFPEGVWEERFNSDLEEFGGLNYHNKDRKEISANNQNLKLAPNSISILYRIK